MSVPLDPKPEEVDVHESLLADPADRDRAFEDVILLGRTSRDAPPAAGLKLLSALPEDVVALSGAVHKVDAVSETGMRCVPCRICTPVDRLARRVVHEVAIYLEAPHAGGVGEDRRRESNIGHRPEKRNEK